MIEKQTIPIHQTPKTPTDMEKKLYCVSYASFNESDPEVYSETIGVYDTEEEALETLESLYNSVLTEDFYVEEDELDNIPERVHAKRTHNAFWVDNYDNYVSARVELKIIGA